jgi:lysophospholipase L1-like esterase
MKFKLLISFGVFVMMINSVLSMEPQRIVVTGASIMSYRGTLNIASFQLDEYLKRNKISAIVFNSGRPGATTQIAKKRFPLDVSGLYPDLVFMMVGTNDSTLDVHRGKKTPRVSPEEYASNLSSMISEMKKNKCAFVIMTLPPVYMTDRLRKYYGKEPYLSKGFNFMVNDYCTIIRKVAKEQNIPCIDLNKAFWLAVDNKYERLPELFLDGMHPNNKGQAIIAEKILELIKRNPQLLKNRSIYSGKIKCLEVVEPKVKSKWTKNVAFKIKAIDGAAKLEYRFKAHYGKKRKKHFGDWIPVKFLKNVDCMEGLLPELLPRKYSLQFRVMDKNSKILAVGAVDHILVK